VLGSALYAPYLFACSGGPRASWRAAQAAGSAALGLGAGVLWVSQGSFLTALCSEANRGRWSGVFWCSFMCGNAAGNFATYVLLDQEAPISTVFQGLAAVSLLSTMLLLLLVRPTCRRKGDGAVAVEEGEVDEQGDDDWTNRSYARKERDEQIEQKKQQQREGGGGSAAPAANAGAAKDDLELALLVAVPATSQHLYRPAATLCEDMQALRAGMWQPSVAALLPALVFIGCENSFWSGAFTDIAGKTFGNKDVALLSGVLALVDMAASVLAGLALDSKCVRFHAMQSVALCMFAAGSVMVWMVRQGAGGGVLSPFTWAMVGSVLMGGGDGIINTAVITRLGSLAEAKKLMSRRTAFQIFQCVNVAMTAITFGVLSAFPSDKSLVVWYVLFASVVGVVGCSLAERFCAAG
jgi:hypothetical protein